MAVAHVSPWGASETHQFKAPAVSSTKPRSAGLCLSWTSVVVRVQAGLIVGLRPAGSTLHRFKGRAKDAMLGVARQAREGEGFTVRGAALSGIAAENLEAAWAPSPARSPA